MGTATLVRPVATFSIAEFKSGTTTPDITVGAPVNGMIPWAGVIVVEGVKSGDRRSIAPGALSWPELPLPLMAQWTNPVGGDGHDGATLAGRIDSIERIDEMRVWATGMIDPESPGGPILLNALSKGLMRGVSVDLDDVEFGTTRDSVKTITTGRIRGATATPFQAFIESTIELTATEALAASGGARLFTARVWTPYDPVESLAVDLENLVAAGAPRKQSPIPVAPPLEWFAKRSFNEYTPLHIGADGRIYGHIAGFGTCHISFGRCVPVPRSKTNYAAFRNGSVLTADGEMVRTGPIIMDTVHPDLKWKASDSMAFYAHSGCAVADVIPYEDQFGIAVVGALRPTVRPEEVRALRGSDISPDWRTVNGKPHECVALLAVNVSGFKLPQTLAASAGDYVMPGDTAAAFDLNDELFALVASGAYSTPQESPLDDHADCGCGGTDPDDCGCDDTAEYAAELTGKLVRQYNVRWSLQERFCPKARVFRAPKPGPTVRVFRSATAEFHGGGSHNQADHGNWAGGGGGRASGTGSGVSPADKNGGPIEDGSPQAVDLSRGTMTSTRAPSKNERSFKGDDVDNTIRNTYVQEGMEWDPPVTAAEALNFPKPGSLTLGEAYDALGAKEGREGQDRLMHRWRKGETLPTPRYDDQGESVEDPWVVRDRTTRAQREKDSAEYTTRVFRSATAEFHGGGSHNQADHGNRVGIAMDPRRASRPRGSATDAADPRRASRPNPRSPVVTGDTNQTGGFWEHINRTEGSPNRADTAQHPNLVTRKAASPKPPKMGRSHTAILDEMVANGEITPQEAADMFRESNADSDRYAVRTFRSAKAEFHGGGSHNQADHGNRAGARNAGNEADMWNDATGATGERPMTKAESRELERSRRNRSSTGSPKKGGTLSNGDKVASLGNPKASKSGYDPDKGMRVDKDGIPIVHWKTQRGRLEKNAWNLVRTDNSDLTDDNVYGPGKTYAPAPPSPPYWVYIGSDGYGDKSREQPAELKDFEPTS